MVPATTTPRRRETLRRSAPDRRIFIELIDHTQVSVQMLADSGHDHIAFFWPTPLGARELMELCSAFQKRHDFVSDVRVVVFPGLEAASPDNVGNRIMDWDEYLENAELLDEDAAAVRFNVSSPEFGRFAIIWTSRPSNHSEARGSVQAIFERTPEMMEQMMISSITARGGRFVTRIIGESRKLQVRQPTTAV